MAQPTPQTQTDAAKRTATPRRVANLRARGFDETYALPGIIRPKCSCCDVLVINGVACHESGCPNAVHECKGCDALVPMNVRYCEDCR